MLARKNFAMKDTGEIKGYLGGLESQAQKLQEKEQRLKIFKWHCVGAGVLEVLGPGMCRHQHWMLEGTILIVASAPISQQNQL